MICIDEILSVRTAVNIYTIKFLTSTASRPDDHDIALEILLRIVMTFYVNISR